MRNRPGVPPIDPLRAHLEATREGDDRALAELVRLTEPSVWRLCTALGSPGEEEDLVQETYLRAWRSIGRFRGESTVQVWLMSIGRRVCADHVRRLKRQRRLIDRLERYADHSPPPSSESLDDLVAALDPDRRDAFVLTQILGLSYEETAQVLECPIGTIRSRVARARRDLIERHAVDEAI